jgi:hypothetical protein
MIVQVMGEEHDPQGITATSSNDHQGNIHGMYRHCPQNEALCVEARARVPVFKRGRNV